MEMIANPFAVVILAAGKGTRMNSDLPKVLHEINGKPMITQVVETAEKIGAERIIPVVGYKHELVQDALKNYPVNFAYQLEQLGTAHAVMQCSSLLKDFKGNVLILYGDVPLITSDTLKHLLHTHESENTPGTILTTDLPDPFGYGRVIRNEDGSLNRIVEEKDASNEEKQCKEVNTGFYVFTAEVLFDLLPQVGNNNAQGEYYLPDVLNLIIAKNQKVAIDKIKNYNEIQGVNTVEQLTELAAISNDE
ncbi:MAG: NTP transferase domain-containing protein [Candidatus Marinimicrobia bacterium]|jgi:UDP-N-acetylglucosamine diphosphorylase/glucosamine-1-phosphate N-acetyltransferase|nr:NTP transferase domain-containing protein [Candidatus Neomarinimicrobiota bacterium]MDP6853473.1 NTP transferase domain-containing protein [Candidatus Neomarinimicrobiota bacterium]